MDKGETIEHLLMGREDGMLMPGLRIKLMDRAHNEEIGGLQGKYMVSMTSTEPDGWLIYAGKNEIGSASGEGPWMFAPNKLVMEKCEDLGAI